MIADGDILARLPNAMVIFSHWSAKISFYGTPGHFITIIIMISTIVVIGILLVISANLPDVM